MFDKQYTYNPPNTSQMNNGNIYTVTNVKDSTRTQTFTYDVLNRLASAHDGTHWGNTYTYDAWGNMQKIPGSPAGENFQHAADGNNHLIGYSYDAAGNMTNDGSHTYTYDAENRITAGAGVTYTYDADGRRVKKSSGTNYWYGPGGQVLAETDSSGNWTNYIFFAGQRLARNVPQAHQAADIKYYITDHLHSTAMFVDKAGTTSAIQDDNDFYPWGGVVTGVGKTTSTNHYKFTAKERDSESQLDYFGARFYANATGRFMSPDWAAKPVTVPYAEFGDPQSLNLYAYVRNSPIVRVDADGHNYAGWNGAGADTSGGIATAEEYYSDKDGHRATPAEVAAAIRAAQGHGPTKDEPRPSSTETSSNTATHEAGHSVIADQTQQGCSAQLRIKSVGTPYWWLDIVMALLDWNHAFWVVTGSTGEMVLTGGPEPPSGPNSKDNEWATATAGTSDENKKAAAYKTTGRVWFDSGTSPNNCSQVDAMIIVAAVWPQGQIPYNIGGFGAPNSNSNANFLGNVVGGWSVPQPPGTWGWNTPVPAATIFSAISSLTAW